MEGILNEIIEAKRKYKQKKLAKHDLDAVRRNAYDLASALSEYAQRKELIELEKRKIVLAYNSDKEIKKAELFIFRGEAFLVPDISKDEIKKIDSEGKIAESDKSELAKALKIYDHKAEMKITSKMFEALKKLLGEFEIII